MVGWQQPGAAGDDAVAVVVGVAGKRDVVAILARDQALHGVIGRRIHADPAIPVQRHESELRVDLIADGVNVDPVPGCYPRPVMHPCAAEWIDADLQAGVADDVEVDDVAEVSHVGVDEVVFLRGRAAARPFERPSRDAVEAGTQQRIRPVLDPAGDRSICRPSVRRVVFEAAVFGWVVRRCNDDAVRQTAGAPAVVTEDGVRDHGRWREAVLLRSHDQHAVRGEHLQRGLERRLRQGMRIDGDEQGAVDPGHASVIADAPGRSRGRGAR